MAGGHPIVNMALEASAAVLRARLRRAARVGLAGRRVGRRERRRAIAVMARHEHPRALPGRRPSARPAPGGDAELMKTAMERSAEGELSLGADPVPDQRLRPEAEMSLGRLRGLLLRRLPGRPRRPGRGLGAGSGGDQAARGMDRGPEEVHIRAPAPTSLGIAGRTFIAADGKHNMPDGEFFTGPVEDSVKGEVTFTYRPSTGAARSPACGCVRGRQGRRRQRRAERGVPDRDARHRRGRAPPRRARDRHQLRDRPLHQGDPARREDRRHRPPRGRHVLSRDGWHNESAVHWDMVCDLRKGGRIRSTARSSRRRQVRRLAIPQPSSLRTGFTGPTNR